MRGTENFLKLSLGLQSVTIELFSGPSLIAASLAMRSLIRLHGARAQPLPQLTQKVTEFQGVTHESGASARDKAAFNNHKEPGGHEVYVHGQSSFYTFYGFNDFSFIFITS